MDKKIYELSELIDKDLAENIYTKEEKFKLAEKYKSCIPENAMVLAQANPISGNIKYNALKAKKWIEWAEILGIKTIVFPEAFLMGIPFGDYLLKFPVIVEECCEWMNALAQLTRNTKVIIGFVESNNSDKNKKYYNSIAVLANGKIEKTVKKSLLLNHAELNDCRYFESSPIDSENRITTASNKKAGIIIGEDTENNFVFCDKNLSPVDTVETIIKEQHPDFLINCSASVTRTKKEQLKHNMLSSAAIKFHTPIVYVNQVGSSDCLSFDGASRVYDADGQLIYRAKSYEEQFFIIDIFDNEGQIYPLPKGLEKALNLQKEFSLNYEPDLERTYKTIIQSIRDYFKKTGFKHACLGLSGGLDSTVCAVLLADAIGKENVFGISMPSKITSLESKNDAKELAENLGISFLEVPIKEIYDVIREKFNNLFSQMEKNWNFRYKQSYTNDNIQARTRATILWGIANEFEKCLPIATSDKSEAYMGYATINGDMSGGYAPIADVTKTKLFALAKWMNKNREQKNSIPQSIIDKRPGAELAINPKTGKPLLAEEALMPYEFLDEIIWRVENLNQSINDMINIEFLYEKTEPVSKEQKLEWLEKFFHRMAAAGYKWSILPPAPIVDEHSINSAEYHQPIISSGINYKKTHLEDKIALIND